MLSIAYGKNIRGAPDSDFCYPAGYRICRISEINPAGYCPDILFNLNTRMSSKKDQIHLSACIYLSYVKLFVKT